MKKHDARDLNLNLNPKLLKPLYQIRPSVHATDMALNWLIILLSAWLCIQFFNPVLYILAVFIIGARMHALAILMHDASHYRFLKNRKWNDRLTNIFTMYPFFLTIENYRDNHLKHHRHLNTDHDPDWVTKFNRKAFQFPTTKWEFLKTLLTYIVLYQGIKDAIWFAKRFNVVGGESRKKTKKNSPNQLVYYAIVIVLLTVFGLWKYFLLFWLVPYFSTFLMFQYIRSVAEHFGDLDYDHLLSSTRTVKTNWLERFLIAPHNVGFHLEHHLYPGVPYYNLPKLHKLLMDRLVFNEKAHITYGYCEGLLKELI